MTAHRKDRSVFFAALKNGDKENWFGPVVSGEPTELTITADNIDRTAPGAAQLEVTLQGVTSNPDLSPDHTVGVLVNGTDVGEMTFDGQADAVHTFAVPVEVLIDGDNVVTMIARGGDADYSLVDLIRLTYWHTFRADADLLRATVDAAGPVTIGGFASAAIRVMDITDPSATTELRGTIRTAGGFSSITVRAQGQGARTLLAFSDATVAAPASIEANHPSTWHARTQAHNWIAISHGDFIDQVKPLAALRGREGYHAAVVNVADIYDEFSFGEKTPQALKDFLQFAKTNWREAPRFVVLVGDATIDPRDYAELGDADFVPTKQVPMAGVSFETASDDWFVDFNGDALPDVPIGRLSVRTGEQAAAMVAKIVNYDPERSAALDEERAARGGRERRHRQLRALQRQFEPARAAGLHRAGGLQRSAGRRARAPGPPRRRERRTAHRQLRRPRLVAHLGQRRRAADRTKTSPGCCATARGCRSSWR